MKLRHPAEFHLSYSMPPYPPGLIKAKLIKRIYRFVAEVASDNAKINVYVPNTGRLSELALPGTEVLLSPIDAKYRYKILYILSRSYPVMIDSTYSNRLFLSLLTGKKVPGLEHYTSIKSEPVYGNHRFDFLLSDGAEEVYIELKSCTLFYNRTGAFPDAVSSRASEHVKELAESGKGELIFLVLKGSIKLFIPNYHTDFTFYETLKSCKSSIKIRALSVQYDDNLKIQSLKDIPVVIPEISPAGIFLLVLFNSADSIDTGGEITEAGYYIYCSSYEENVFKKISSIKKKNGINSILPDKCCSEMKIISDLPVVESNTEYKEIEKRLLACGGLLHKLNHSGNNSENGIIHFKVNPLEKSWFWDLILELRFSRYE